MKRGIRRSGSPWNDRTLPGLERQPQRELQAALRAGHRARDPPEVAVTAQRPAVSHVHAGGAELRRVEQIECFRAELKPPAFREPEVLEHGEVERLGGWASHCLK